jgi:hypothetical protein
MKKIALAFALLTLAGCAAPYAPRDFDFSQLDGGSAGFIESVQMHATPASGEDRFVVRLDNGFSVAAMGEGLERFEPGQRVRLLRGARGVRVLAE